MNDIGLTDITVVRNKAINAVLKKTVKWFCLCPLFQSLKNVGSSFPRMHFSSAPFSSMVTRYATPPLEPSLLIASVSAANKENKLHKSKKSFKRYIASFLFCNETYHLKQTSGILFLSCLFGILHQQTHKCRNYQSHQ